MNIKISVRSLVEFIFRSGDISDSSSGTLSREAMNAGSRIHRKLQKRAGSHYNSEVPLRYTEELGGHLITVEGRADGIIDRCGGEQEESGDIDDGFDMAEGYAVDFHDSDVLIDEIKGIYRNLDDMESPQRVHVAQAMCYAYIYSKENNYSWIDVRISYVNLDSEKEKFFRRRYSFGYLEKWFRSMMAELCKWIDLVEKHQLMRNQSISDMEFPFEYRKGQKEMALYVYRAIEQEKHLYVQAPTGIGKTMAAVYPSIKSMVQGHVSKIFYLTAKTIAHTVSRNAVELLEDRGLRLKTVILTAKEKICCQEQVDCNPAVCPYAEGHFDRVNDALYDVVLHETVVDRDVVIRYAQAHRGVSV